jgi:CheY-like chemotaxis protein
MKTTSELKQRILVVDDEPAVAQVIELMLRFEGHEVQMVTSGKDALSALEYHAFNAIVLDYAMPDMNGDELAYLIKQSRPKQIIIMLSALADTLRNSEQKIRAVDAFVSKPFLLEDLRAVLANLLTTA